jgi:aspartokinase-like uncharacterized kinase
MEEGMNDLLVVKVGGSLYDWPDLGSRLRSYLDAVRAEAASALRIILVPGGGPTADAVRTLDRVHLLGDERSHRLALRAMTLNAHFIAALLPEALIIDDPFADVPSLGIVDVLPFLDADEERYGRTIPHSWDTTSDAIAARLAVAAEAARLVLLKSVTTDAGTANWDDMARRQIVDPVLPAILRTARHPIEVSLVNLRAWPR